MKALKRTKSKTKIPSYGRRGTHRSAGKFVLMTIGCFIILIGLVILAIRIPALVNKKETEKIYTAENPVLIKPDESGIRNMQEYVRDHQKDDFDNDGLINSDEIKYGTDPRDPDTDKDGVCDYAEVYLYNSRPGQKDSQLATIVSDMLKANNIEISSPFKLHDIIMWADNLSSRSAGTVIPTIRGYRFKKFNGWVQFPGQVYAYKLNGKLHEPLPYREKENAWRIVSESEDVEVVLYTQPLETIHLLDFFGKKYYVTDKTISDIFDILLPTENSFITCKSIVKQDTYDIEVPATVTEIVMPEFDRENMSRFARSTVDMEDLTKVYTAVISGKTTAVSLQSQQRGEVLGVIYGYTDFGDLLFADEFGNKASTDGNPYILNIKEQSAITLDQTGTLRQREYFDYSGLGFDSEAGDKICFIFPDP